MCLKVDVFIVVKNKPGNSGGPEVIWEFDDRLKIEQVRDMNRVVRLRNSVIHVLPAPLSKEILCFESGCHPRTHLLESSKYTKRCHYAIKKIGNQTRLLLERYIASYMLLYQD